VNSIKSQVRTGSDYFLDVFFFFPFLGGDRVGVDDGVGVSCGGGGVDGGVDVGEHGDALNVMRRGGLDGIFYGVRASQDPCCCSSS